MRIEQTMIAVLAAGILLLGGCAGHEGALIGGGVGGGAGAAIGGVPGAVIGGAAGAVIGGKHDRRHD